MTKIPTTAPAIEDALSGFADTVEDARRALSDGQVRNLEPLEKQTIVICENIRKLPGAQAQELQLTVIGLISKLELFADELDQFISSEKGKNTDAGA